jgi:hypothetical protein
MSALKFMLIQDRELGTVRKATADEIIRAARACIANQMRRGASLASPKAVRDYLVLRFGALQHEVFSFASRTVCSVTPTTRLASAAAASCLNFRIRRGVAQTRYTTGALPAPGRSCPWGPRQPRYARRPPQGGLPNVSPGCGCQAPSGNTLSRRLTKDATHRLRCLTLNCYRWTRVSPYRHHHPGRGAKNTKTTRAAR